MATRNPQAIENQFEAIEQGRNNNQNLVFDPRTGELVVQSTSEPLPNADAVIATQTAEKGFFL